MNEGPAIEAEGLVKHYGTTQALSGFDLTVPVGTVRSNPDSACVFP